MKRFWCLMGRHPRRYLKYWCVRAEENGAVCTQALPRPPTIRSDKFEGRPFVFLEWLCRDCGTRWAKEYS